MAKEQIPFEDFLMDVGEHAPFVLDLHQWLLDSGCTFEIKSAKSGLVVSYLHNKRTVLNYIFRKKGPLMRLYADNLTTYADLMDTLPERMQKELRAASPCRRLLDPEKCNSRCPMGYTYTLGGEVQKKCRYSAFQFFLGEDANPFLKALLEREIGARQSA